MREELNIPMPAMSPSYRVPRRQAAMEPNTKRLLMIAGGIGGVLLLVVGAYALSGRHGGGVPVIEAASGPVRVKPANPGGMQVAGQDELILGGGGSSDAHAALAPPPEAPLPQALKAQEQTAQKAQELKAQELKTQEQAAVVPPHQGVAPVALASVAPAAPAPVAAIAQPRPEPRPVMQKPVAPVARPAQAAIGRGPQVQLAALTSEQAAITEWHRLAHKMPAVFDGRKPAVMKYERDGRVFWRLRTGGFSDRAEATSFCEQVKAKGGGCEVTRS